MITFHSAMQQIQSRNFHTSSTEVNREVKLLINRKHRCGKAGQNAHERLGIW